MGQRTPWTSTSRSARVVGRADARLVAEVVAAVERHVARASPLAAEVEVIVATPGGLPDPLLDVIAGRLRPRLDIVARCAMARSRGARGRRAASTVRVTAVDGPGGLIVRCGAVDGSPPLRIVHPGGEELARAGDQAASATPRPALRRAS